MGEYNQPFYIPFGRGKMNYNTGIRGGYYLPALEPDVLTIDERLAKLEEVPKTVIVKHETVKRDEGATLDI